MKPLRFLLIAPCFALVTLAADSPAPAVAPTQVTVALGKPAPAAVQADPAAVEAALKALRYDAMMGKMLNQQKQAVLAFARQMLARAALPPSVSKAELAAFPQKAVDSVWAGLKLEETQHAIVARSFGEVFTTDELRAIAAFYNSAAGQAFLVKRPDVEQKIGAALRQPMLQVMPRIQKMVRDFTAQQRANAEKASAGASSAPVSGHAPTTSIPSD